MKSHTDWQYELAQFASDVSEATGLEDAASRVTTFALAATGASAGGLTLLRSGGKKFESVGCSSPLVIAADALQYAMTEGPCVDASTTSRTLWATDLASDQRWPRWGPTVHQFGFKSILSAELHAGQRRIGAINCYSTTTDTFSYEDAALLHLFALHAGAAIAAVQKQDNLKQAVDTRTAIAQAQGIVMAVHSVSADEAWAQMSAHSQSMNRKVSELAREIIDTREVPFPATARVKDKTAQRTR